MHQLWIIRVICEMNFKHCSHHHTVALSFRLALSNNRHTLAHVRNTMKSVLRPKRLGLFTLHYIVYTLLLCPSEITHNQSFNRLTHLQI